MKLGKRKRPNEHIPSDSQADIAFLLLVFFMVSTVFKTGSTPNIQFPEAESVEKLPKRNVAAVWISKDNIIMIDGKQVPESSVPAVMSVKAQNRKLMTALNADKTIKYGFIMSVFERFKEASALKVSLNAKKPGK